MAPAAQTIGIAAPVDVQRARRAARGLTRALGFGVADGECVVLTVSELATNLLRYACNGEICLSVVGGARGMGVEVESRDSGPGIADLNRSLADGTSTAGGLGSGLPAARRLMDTFAITSRPEGTRIVARKWPTARS
jgi:serine/threonine-protein kinase RsbT